jgi:hypothetical protein
MPKLLAGWPAAPPATHPLAMCVPGCLNAPGCANGICLANSSEARDWQGQETLATSGATHASNATIVLAAAPTSAVQYAGQGDCWFAPQMKFGAQRRRILDYAKAHSAPFIDMYARFRRDAPGGATVVGSGTCSGGLCSGSSIGCANNADCVLNDPRACYRDAIHWAAPCEEIAAQAVADCVANLLGTHDGACGAVSCTGSLCAAGARQSKSCSSGADCATCTAGRVGDTCATDADCSTYDCTF